MNYEGEKFLLKLYNDLDKEESVIKADKKRASYYNFYSEKRWGEAKSYQLCLNSSVLGYEGCVDMIIDFVEKKNSRK